jgi:phosphomannomutase
MISMGIDIVCRYAGSFSCYNGSMKKRLLRGSKPYQNKELIVFDLDGTLTESKANLAPDMARALGALLAVKKVAVIGGGRYAQFRKQFVSRLAANPALFRNLFLFPTTGTSFYRYGHGWRSVYEKSFPIREKKKIRNAFKRALAESHYERPKRIWGAVIDDRHTQLTFSALGQKAPLAAKERWNRTRDIRPALIKKLRKLLPECAVHQGGLTSVDVTVKGIDKAYGIRQMRKHLHVPIGKMLFIGDALAGHGNDAPAKRTGVTCIAVAGPHDTRRIIMKILKANRNAALLPRGGQ